MAPLTIVPVDRVRSALIEQWAQLRSLATQLDDDAWHRDSILPGWTVADIVAHIIGTESLLAGRPVPDIDISDAAHVRNPIGELNERWLRHFAATSRPALIDAFDEIVDVRTTALDAMSQSDFDDQTLTPAGPDSYGRFMRIRIFDCWMHDVDLRDSLSLAPPVQTAPAQWAVTEIFASLPYVVGKRAGTPAGTRVGVEVMGATSATAHVEVAERARLVDDFGSAAADVSLRVDAIDLARLVGGRSTANPASVTVKGDVDLAGRIVANLDYVI